MKRLFLIPLFLLFAAPAHSQAIQSKTCEPDASGYVQPCSFDKPVTQGDLIVVTALAGCDSSMFNDIPSACRTALSDNQGNVWQVAQIVPFYGLVPLLYALDAKGGPDTISFKRNVGRLAIIAEYPPSSGLDDANYGTYNAQNPHGDPQGQSSDFGSTMVVVTSQPNDLLIAWGWSGGPLNPEGTWIIKPGPYFMIREQMHGGFVLEDSIAPIEGAYFGTVHWAGYGHWVAGCAAFKRKP